MVQRRHGMKAVASEAARASWVISADASPSASYNVKSDTCLREQHVEDLIRVIIGTTTWGIIGKSAPVLADITIRKSQQAETGG